MTDTQTMVSGLLLYAEGEAQRWRATCKEHLQRLHTGVGSLKTCGKCGDRKLFTEFHKEKRGAFGLRSDCAVCCSRQRSAHARAKRKENPEEVRRLARDRSRLAYAENRHGKREYVKAVVAARRVAGRRIPPWTNWQELRAVYEGAARLSTEATQLQVDHIYPVNGKTVCGLNCPANLQLLERSLNQSKGNKMPSGLLDELWVSDPKDVHYE